MWTKFKETFKLCRFDKPLLEIPFLFTSAFIVSEGFPDYLKLIYMFLAVISGFMIGNVINGVADRKIDKINPRTKDRPVANGTLSVKYCIGLCAVLFVILIVSTFLINPIYVLLLPIPAGLVLVYSFMKRKTILCHLVLGLVSAIAPVAAWGIFGSWLDYRGLFMGAVPFFISIGFDMIYSSQDVDYDIMTGMHSIPVKYGVAVAKRISLLLHIFTIGSLIILGIICNVGIIMWIAIVIGCITIVCYQYIVQIKVEKMDRTINMYQIFSGVLMIGAIAQNIISK